MGHCVLNLRCLQAVCRVAHYDAADNGAHCPRNPQKFKNSSGLNRGPAAPSDRPTKNFKIISCKPSKKENPCLLCSPPEDQDHRTPRTRNPRTPFRTQRLQSIAGVTNLKYLKQREVAVRSPLFHCSVILPQSGFTNTVLPAVSALHVSVVRSRALTVEKNNIPAKRKLTLEPRVKRIIWTPQTRCSHHSSQRTFRGSRTQELKKNQRAPKLCAPIFQSLQEFLDAVLQPTPRSHATFEFHLHRSQWPQRGRPVEHGGWDRHTEAT